MSLAALLRPTLNLYSPRQRSTNDAFPTSRTNPSGARQAMQPARINTSSKSGLPRDPEQWTDEDLATCARKHFKLERTAPLLDFIDEFRLTPAALWYLQTDDEELSRLTDGNTELQEQVVDLAIHIRPAVSPTTPRRMNAMQLQVVLDIPAPAPPPPPPPEEPEVVEDDDDDAARSVVSDWALEEQAYEQQQQAVEDAPLPDTHAAEAEHEPFPPPGGALGLDTTGGQQAETPVEAAHEHMQEPEEEAEPQQATAPERTEDLIQFDEDEAAEDHGASVPISQVVPDIGDGVEAETTEASGQEPPAEDVQFFDEEEKQSEHGRAVPVHDEYGSQDDFESVEPSQTGSPSEDDLAADDDSTAQRETQAEELVAEATATTEEASAPAAELPATEGPAATAEEPAAAAVVPLATVEDDLPATTEEPLATETPAPSEAQPQAGAEEHVAEDSAALPDTDEHEDAEAAKEELPEPEASSDDVALAPEGSATSQVVTQTEVPEEQREDSLAATDDVQTAGEGNLAQAARSETPEESALADDSHPGDVQDATAQGRMDDTSEHAESQEQATPLAETPHEIPGESSATQNAQDESVSTQDAQLAAPEVHTEEDTMGAGNSSGATSVDNSISDPHITPEEGAATVQPNTNTEPEHVDDGGEDDSTTLPQTTVALDPATASSPGTHTPSESSPSSPIQQQADTDTIQPRRAFDTQSPPSLSLSTTSPLTFGIPSVNKFATSVMSFGSGFRGRSLYSPPALGFSFSSAASGSGRSATPSNETSQLPPSPRTAESSNVSEPVQSPAEYETPPASTQRGDDSEEKAVPEPEPESRPAVEGDAAKDVADHVEEAMSSSVLQEDGQAPADRADPVLADAPSGEGANAETSAEAHDEDDGYIVMMSPPAVETPLRDREQDAPQETKEGGEVDGSLEPGWQTVGNADVTQANVQEGESSAVVSPTAEGPAVDPEEAEEDGGDDDDGGSEGDKPEGGSGGGGGASKRKRKKASGSKKKKGKKGK